MTGICYNGPYAYANLGYDNWPSENIASPSVGVFAALLLNTYVPTGWESLWADVSAREVLATAYGYTPGGMVVTLNNTIATNLLDDFAGEMPFWVVPPAVQVPEPSKKKGKVKGGLKVAGSTTPLNPRWVVYYLNGTIKGHVKPLISYQDLGAGISLSPIAVYQQLLVVLENGSMVVQE